MRAFACPTCRHLVFFHNSACLQCDTGLAFDPVRSTLVATAPEERCPNATVVGCNWLAGPDGSLCRSCELTRTRPPDDDPNALAGWAEAEEAKRSLCFELLELRLPFDAVAFDLLSSRHEPVTTGHADGVITLDLAESDSAHREQVRVSLQEPYRTVLGHLRHEIGHFYWPLLVERDDDELAAFRELFGDDRADYGSAIHDHYGEGPTDGWQDDYVSAYATMHPWEDWAETFAHYLHIRDALQTAGSFGLRATGPVPVPDEAGEDLVANARPDLRARWASIEDVVSDWLALTYALNAMNRSMGHRDLYPFVLAPRVIDKLGYVHRLVVSAAAQA